MINSATALKNNKFNSKFEFLPEPPPAPAQAAPPGRRSPPRSRPHAATRAYWSTSMLRPANVAESTYDPGVEYSLEYIDEDGDTILVSNQDHLDVALRLLPTGNKLKLTSRQKVSETPPGAVTVEHYPPQQQQLDQPPAGGAVNIEAELPKQSATTTRGHRGRRIMASTGTRNGASASKALAASGPVTTVTTKRTRSAAAKSKAADDVAAATNLFSARKS